jgi:FolB domain-containing protein
VTGGRADGCDFAQRRARDAEQPVDLDIRIEMDLSAPAASDDLGDTLDYADLHQRVVGIVQSTSFVLLERLAAEIIHAIFRDPRVARAAVSIAKPQLLDGATPSVRLCRDNPRCVPR